MKLYHHCVNSYSNFAHRQLRHRKIREILLDGIPPVVDARNGPTLTRSYYSASIIETSQTLKQPQGKPPLTPARLKPRN